MQDAKSGITPIAKAAEGLAANPEMAEDFLQFYRENLDGVYYFLLSRVRDAADAEDLTSQTFLSAYEHQHRLRDRQKFRAWVFTIARNKSVDFFRKRGRQPQADLNEAWFLPDESAGLSPDQQDRLISLAGLVSRLSPQEQEYLQLRLIAQLPFAEMARVLRKTEASVKKTYYRILGRLQSQAEEI